MPLLGTAREEICCYRDEHCTELLWTVSRAAAAQFRAVAYLIVDAHQIPVARVQPPRRYQMSHRWIGTSDHGAPLLVLEPASGLVALVGRVLGGSVPLVARRSAEGPTVGSLTQGVLDLRQDQPPTIDRELAIVLAALVHIARATALPASAR